MSDPARDAFWQRVTALAKALDRMSYYDLLGVDPAADVETIKAAYYRRAPGTHPDRHTYERDRDRMRALTRLYARFGEAFRVLKSTELRAAYDAARADGATRLTRDAQNRATADSLGPDPKTPHARSLYQEGRALMKAGDPAAALTKLRLAAQFERDSRVIPLAIEDAEEALALDSLGI